MSLKTKRECLEKVRVRYRRAGRLNKINILTAFCEDCGYERKYASKLLSGKRGIRTGKKSGREKIYRVEILLKPLKAIWLASHQPCSKRLVGALPLRLRYTPEVKPEIAAQLVALSASSIDRMLRPVRISMGPKGRCTTKPGTLLKKQMRRTQFEDVALTGSTFNDVDLSGSVFDDVNLANVKNYQRKYRGHEGIRGKRCRSFCCVRGGKEGLNSKFKQAGLLGLFGS